MPKPLYEKLEEAEKVIADLRTQLRQAQQREDAAVEAMDELSTEKSNLAGRLQQAQEELARWKASRIFYQDRMYAVCNELDRTFGNKPGQGVVVEEAANAVKRLGAERDEARARGEGLYLLCNVWVNQRDAANERGMSTFRALRRTWTRFFEMKARAEAAEALLAIHHQDRTGTWKACPVCAAKLIPAEVQKEGD